MGVSILSDWVGKPFSVHPATDDDYIMLKQLKWVYSFPVMG